MVVYALVKLPERYIPAMEKQWRAESGAPTDLGNMRSLGVRGLSIA
jgi:hypothetical protein